MHYSNLLITNLTKKNPYVTTEYENAILLLVIVGFPIMRGLLRRLKYMLAKNLGLIWGHATCLYAEITSLVKHLLHARGI